MRVRQNAPVRMLGWVGALVLAMVLAAGAVALRRWGGRRGRVLSLIAQETCIVVVLFALWQIAGKVSLGGSEHAAFTRAERIADVQRALHLPSEVTLQRQVLPYPTVVRAANLFYYYAHFNSMMVFLAWLYLRHRERYRWGRNIVVWLTAGCLLVQLAPVAPPRLLPELGFVDTGVLFDQSIYGGRLGLAVADQLSAMPSVHMGWAILISLAVITVSESRWRWWILLHPVLTAYVVVITGNHWWLDGIVAAAILGVGVAVENSRYRRAMSAVTPEPGELAQLASA